MTVDYSRTIPPSLLLQIHAFFMDFFTCNFRQQSVPLRLSKLSPSEHFIVATSRSSIKFSFLHCLGIYPLDSKYKSEAFQDYITVN